MLCDENGDTRRQRNSKFGVESPTPNFPKGTELIVVAFSELCTARQRTESKFLPMSWSDINAFVSMRANWMSSSDIGLLKEMDKAFVDSANNELSAIVSRRFGK